MLLTIEEVVRFYMYIKIILCVKTYIVLFTIKIKNYIIHPILLILMEIISMILEILFSINFYLMF